MIVLYPKLKMLQQTWILLYVYINSENEIIITIFPALLACLLACLLDVGNSRYVHKIRSKKYKGDNIDYDDSHRIIA